MVALVILHADLLNMAPNPGRGITDDRVFGAFTIEFQKIDSGQRIASKDVGEADGLDGNAFTAVFFRGIDGIAGVGCDGEEYNIAALASDRVVVGEDHLREAIGGDILLNVLDGFEAGLEAEDPGGAAAGGVKSEGSYVGSDIDDDTLERVGAIVVADENDKNSDRIIAGRREENGEAVAEA
ncbi:MAG: hypothetical protein R2762_28150 [Bryobacteraceae bacterium]